MDLMRDILADYGFEGEIISNGSQFEIEIKIDLGSYPSIRDASDRLHDYFKGTSIYKNMDSEINELKSEIEQLKMYKNYYDLSMELAKESGKKEE